MRLDQIDLRILEALQTNNLVTSEQLGEIAGVSPTACQRRLNRLRNNRVIEGDVSIVSPKAIGRTITAVIQVDLGRGRGRADVDQVKASIRSTPEIMMGYYVTGEADFILVVTAEDMEEYEQFTRRYLRENPHVSSLKTMVVMDRVKVGCSLPLLEK